MADSLIDHPSEDLLERYSLGRLTEPERAEVEQHLLVCRSCQDTFAEIDQFIAAIRDAIRWPDE